MTEFENEQIDLLICIEHEQYHLVRFYTQTKWTDLLKADDRRWTGQHATIKSRHLPFSKGFFVKTKNVRL